MTDSLLAQWVEPSGSLQASCIPILFSDQLLLNTDVSHALFCAAPPQFVQFV
jgi:hypothetical protein